MDGFLTPFQTPFAELFLFVVVGLQIAIRGQPERQ